MTYIMSCVWLDYMVKYFQCKNCVGSSPKTKKCVASFLVPGDKQEWALLHRAVSIIKNWLRRDLYAGLQGYVLSPGGAYGDCC